MPFYLESPKNRQVSNANFITLVTPSLHPDRIIQEHDFLYILDGKWDVVQEEEVYSLVPDDLLILSAGRHHHGKSLSSPGSRHMYIHAIPTPQELPSIPASLRPCSEEKKGPAPTDLSFSGSIRLSSLTHCQGNSLIRRLFEDIINSFWTDSSRKQQKLAAMMELLLYEIQDQQEKPCTSSTPDAILENITRTIRTTPQKFFTSAEFAGRYFVSERTLSNYFKRAYGKTLYAYQMDIHLEMARQYLISGNSGKLHEIALNFGFYDEFHLSRAFKKKYGIPPGSYRTLTK